MSIPRRSARLAAKAAKANPPRIVIEEIPPKSKSGLTKEESRAIFLSLSSAGHHVSHEYRMQCVLSIQQYLNDIMNASGRTAKAVLATHLHQYLLNNPKFLAGFDRFTKTLLNKLKELKEEEAIPDATIDAELRQSIADLLFVVHM